MEDNHDDPDSQRQGTTNWCLCEKCGPMPTDKESLCCQELSALDHRLQQEEVDLSCITLDQRFFWGCLDSELLEVAMLSMADLRAERLQRPINSR